MEVELSTDETVRALRVQTLLWTEVEAMIWRCSRLGCDDDYPHRHLCDCDPYDEVAHEMGECREEEE